MDYQYEILKLLIANKGVMNDDDIITELNKEVSEEEMINLKRDAGSKILAMQHHSSGLIEEMSLSEQSDFSNKYLNAGWASMFDNTIIFKIQITIKGRTEFNKLDKLYNPPPPIIPQQNTYITTHGDYSPAIGHDLKIGDIKVSEEQPGQKDINKKILGLTKKQFIWTVIIGLALILLGILALIY